MVAFALDQAHGVLLVTWSVEITADNLVMFDGLLKTLVERHGTKDTIVDFSSAGAMSIETAQLVTRAHFPSRMPGRRRIFVARTDVAFGMLRVYGAHQEQINERAPLIVRTLDEALALMGTTRDQFQPVPI